MLTLTAQVWHKLAFLAKTYPHEVSGFAVSSPEKPFYITDFKLVEQLNDTASTEMTEEGLATYMDEMLEQGKAPVEFMRIWCHTHPKGVNSPSKTDTDTMEEVFSGCDWSIMFIITKELKTYAEIHTKALNETIRTIMDVKVDWETEGTTDTKAWEKEHDKYHSEWEYTYTPYKKDDGELWPNGTEKKYYRQNGTLRSGPKRVEKIINQDPQGKQLSTQTSLFWEYDIVEILLNRGEIEQDGYDKLTASLMRGEALDPKIIDIYKRECLDPYLQIAGGYC